MASFPKKSPRGTVKIDIMATKTTYIRIYRPIFESMDINFEYGFSVTARFVIRDSDKAVNSNIRVVYSNLQRRHKGEIESRNYVEARFDIQANRKPVYSNIRS